MFHAAFGRQRLGGGEERDARLLGMPVDEVEDAVRARSRTVDEAGPGHGALRRDAGAQRAEPAAAAEPIEVGQQARVHHALGQTRVHPVDADNDHALSVAAAGPAAPAAPGNAQSRAQAAANAADCFSTSRRLIFAGFLLMCNYTPAGSVIPLARACADGIRRDCEFL